MTGAASTNERIAGRRVLVAEDNAVIAMDLQMMLEDQGAVILGPVSTVEDALSLAGKGGIDVALLDVDLNGSDALPVIVALSDRQVPVVLVTGHLDIVKRLPEAYRSLTVVGKPFTERTIVSAIEAALPPLEKPVG